MIACFILALVPLVAVAQDSSLSARNSRVGGAEALLQDLACNNCHTGRAPSAEIRAEAPPLGFAGLRYRAGYLYSYLGQPARIRKHIGASRMPDFRLSDQERLALTLYLAEQQSLPQPLPSIPVPDTTRALRNADGIKKILVEELQCASCHTVWGAGGDKASELTEMGWRVTKDWLYRYSAFPQAYEPLSAMPAFFTVSEDRSQLHEVIPGGKEQLWAVASFLDSVGGEQRARQERVYQQVRIAHPSITAAVGEKIFVALNCAACHNHHSIRSRHNALALADEGARVQRGWLQSYLARPTPIRPFGFFPGSGGHMPDFGLTKDEIESLQEYFFSQPQTREQYAPKRLSRFSAAKAETMLRDKLPCLGCHSLRGEGGNIAPDLANVRSRLQPSYALEMVRDPGASIANIIMPKTPLAAREQELLVNYLFQADSSAVQTTYRSLVENPTFPRGDTTTVAGLYTRYCAPCHGETGNADGFNAKFLPVQPAAHGSKEAMEQRADGTLFDGIHSGGAILNKSHRMPAFGATLSQGQIQSLVHYIRALCRCEAPAWSKK